MKKVIDMTEGSPYKSIFKFTVPIVLSLTLQNLYSLGDSLIVSLSRGSDAATGVNLTAALSFLVLGFGQGIAAGFGIVLSQFVGAKDEKQMRRSLATSLSLGTIIALLLTVASVAASGAVLKLMHTDEKFFDYALDYIRAIFFGIIFTMLYNLSDQVMRAMGDSHTPLFILILCAFLNVGLNSLLFVIPALPVGWAGWATIISQGISAVVGFTLIFKRFKVLRLKKQDFKPDLKFAGKHLTMGLPMAFQFMITAISCIIQQSAFNKLGTLEQQAQSTANKVDNIFSAIPIACGNAMATYCGQNFGAKKFDRIKSGVKADMLIGLGFCSAACIMGVTLSVPLARVLLVGADEAVFALIWQYNSMQSLFYYFLFLLCMFRQSLQGINKSGLAMLGGVSELAMRSLGAFVLAELWGYTGACFSNILAWVFTAIMFGSVFIIAYKKLVKKQNALLASSQNVALATAAETADETNKTDVSLNENNAE